MVLKTAFSGRSRIGCKRAEPGRIQVSAVQASHIRMFRILIILLFCVTVAFVDSEKATLSIRLASDDALC